MTLTENFFKHVCETVVRKKMHHILHSLIFPSHAFDCCHFLLNLFAATYLLLSFNSQWCEVSEQEDAPGEGVYSHPVHAAPVVTYTTTNNQAYSWSQIYSCMWQAIVKKTESHSHNSKPKKNCMTQSRTKFFCLGFQRQYSLKNSCPLSITCVCSTQ